MRRDSHHPNKQDFRDDFVYDSPLLIEPRRSEAFPVTRQRLVTKALDCTKALWTERPAERSDERDVGGDGLLGSTWQIIAQGMRRVRQAAKLP